MASSAQSPTALITGASGGIGWELARVFARNGYRLILVARSAGKLAQLAGQIKADYGTEVHTFPHDLATACAARELCDEMGRQGLEVDVLVNNAGFATLGLFAETDPAQVLQLLQLNIVSLTHLTRLLLPGMIRRGSGHVLNVASIAGYFPGPLTATYNASKAYVVSFSLALSEELRGSGVGVTTLCPGPTRTGFEARAGLHGAKAFRDHVMDPRAVAETAYAAVIRRRPVAFPGWRNRLRMLPIKLLPWKVLARFARQYHQV